MQQQQQSALTLARALNLSILLCATSLNVLLTAHHSTGRRGTGTRGGRGPQHSFVCARSKWSNRDCDSSVACVKQFALNVANCQVCECVSVCVCVRVWVNGMCGMLRVVVWPRVGDMWRANNWISRLEGLLTARASQRRPKLARHKPTSGSIHRRLTLTAAVVPRLCCTSRGIFASCFSILICICAEGSLLLLSLLSSLVSLSPSAVLLFVFVRISLRVCGCGFYCELPAIYTTKNNKTKKRRSQNVNGLGLVSAFEMLSSDFDLDCDSVSVWVSVSNLDYNLQSGWSCLGCCAELLLWLRFPGVPVACLLSLQHQHTYTQTHPDSHTYIDSHTDRKTHAHTLNWNWRHGLAAQMHRMSVEAAAAIQRQQQHSDSSNTATATEQGSSRAEPATARRDEPNAHAARIVLDSWQRCQLLLYQRRRRAGHAAKSISFAAKCKRDSWHGTTLGLACWAALVQGRERDIETKARPADKASSRANEHGKRRREGEWQWEGARKQGSKGGAAHGQRAWRAMKFIKCTWLWLA